MFLLSLIALLFISPLIAGPCQEMTCGSGCISYEWLCGRSSNCEWDSYNEDCSTSDGINMKTCCLDDTTVSPTKTPTKTPTSSPTCPDYSLNSNPCQYYNEECCADHTECLYSTSTMCQAEGGPDCCYPVTETPTTANPTTNSPTTNVPTTSTPTTENPTTNTPTTPTPTTDAPTTPIPTVTETDEPTSGSWPTQRPTLKSAMKWEMIHPQYEGNDGELLWHVYYGDFSDDERFDKFRADEKWDAKEIRPIISSDSKFKRYENEELYKEDEQIVTSERGARSSSISYGLWVILMCIAMIVVFACWYKSNLVSKEELSGLLEESKVQYY